MGALLRTGVVAACFVLLVAVPSAHAAFPGANGKIAFAKAPSRSIAQITTIEPNGTGQTRLTSSSGNETHPRWSPDGQRIAFESTQDRAPNCYFPDICRDIWVMNADRSNVTRLTRHETPRDGYAYSPTWSPDGSEIAFANVRLSGDVWVSEIWVMKSDGTNARPVTPINGCCTGVVAWSPDGTEIAYDDGSTFRYNTIYRISTVRPDGTGGKVLRYGATQPDWSPDSARIVFTNDFTSGPEAIMSMDRSGADVKFVYDGANGASHTYPHDPAWSPDGRRIVFARLVGPASSAADAIFTVNADGSGATGLTDGSAPSFNPNWQPIPNRPPDCSNVTATPNRLWPPNNGLVPVTLSGATDPDSDQVTLTIIGVTQDEPNGGRPDATLGPVSNDVSLRATRSGHGDGRVYRIGFTASDGRGGSCSGTATVSVPRKKHKPAVDSAPPNYDSFTR